LAAAGRSGSGQQGIPASPVPRFAARVEVVKLSVVVRGHDGPITGLGAADFEVRDNGVRQRVDSAAMETTPLRAVLAFDVSGSVKGDKLADLKRAAAGLVDELRPGDEAGLLTFGETLRLRYGIGGDRGRLRAEIEGLEAAGLTSLVDGTFAAVVLGDDQEGQTLVIVFTDGRDTSSWLPEAYVLDAVRGSETVIYGVRVGSEASSFLGDVCGATGGRTLNAPTTAGLPRAFLEILDEFRTRYILRYTPTGVARAGWHALDVRVSGRSASVLVRRGYRVGR
jgi:VWFA-related protein